MSFRSPPSRMKANSRHTTYPRMSMIQWWKREKSSGDQTAMQVYFLFVFQELSDDVCCPTDCVPSNPSGPLVDESDKNNISKTQHDPTVDSRYMATGALLVFSKIWSSLSIRFSLFFFFFLFFLFFNWRPICSFVGTFFHNYNFVPHLCLYVFYLFFM